MRTIVLFISFCYLLLLGGSHSLFAGTVSYKIQNTSIQNVTKQHPIKFTNKNKSIALIEEDTIDFDEEFHGSNDLKNRDNSKLFIEKSNFLNNWYLTFAHQDILNNYTKRIKNSTPFCGYSNPIYIKNQVLRI